MPGTVDTSVRRASQGVRIAKRFVRRGLTTSVIGAEEGEPDEAEGNRKKQYIQERSTWTAYIKEQRATPAGQGRYYRNQRIKNAEIYEKGDVPFAGQPGRYAAATGTAARGTVARGTAATGMAASTAARGTAATGMAASTAARGTAATGMAASTAARGTAATGTAASTAARGTAATGTAAGTTATGTVARGTAARGTAAMGTAASTAATGTAARGAAVTTGTAAGAAAGTATAGTATVVMAAAAGARRAEERMRSALEASVMEKENAAKSSTGKDLEAQKSEERKKAWTGPAAAMAAISGLPVLVILFVMNFFLLLIIPTATVFQQQQQGGANRIVEVASLEAAAAEDNIGGGKYKTWFGMDENWCAMFVSWCANECGYIDDGIMPKTASVSVMKSWYIQKGQYHAKESGYEPKPGDVIFFGNGRSHTGLVVFYDAALKKVTAIEGNTGRSETNPYHKGSRVKEKTYLITSDTIIGYGTPQYPMGTVEIPEPYGTEYSYMGWQVITSPTSKQYKLREEAGMNFDENGFGKIGDRYVIACTLTFGQVGDYVDWELSNGTIIKTIVGDIKNQEDAGCNEWGHNNGLCVLEFVVDKESWYGSGRYPTDFHEDWDARVIRATGMGNYWN